MNLNPAASKLTLCGSFLGPFWCVRAKASSRHAARVLRLDPGLDLCRTRYCTVHRASTGTHSNYCPYSSRGDHTHTHTLAQRPRPRPHQSRRRVIEALSTARPVIASVRRAALDARRPLEHGQLTVSHHQPPPLPSHVRTNSMAATAAPPLLRFHPNLVPANHASLRSPAATNPGHPSPPPRCGAGTPPHHSRCTRIHADGTTRQPDTEGALSVTLCAVHASRCALVSPRRRVWLRLHVPLSRRRRGCVCPTFQ